MEVLVGFGDLQSPAECSRIRIFGCTVSFCLCFFAAYDIQQPKMHSPFCSFLGMTIVCKKGMGKGTMKHHGTKMHV